MDLKFEAIVQNFRKIIQLNAVLILESTNEYYRKIISKSGRKMDLYPVLGGGVELSTSHTFCVTHSGYTLFIINLRHR